MNSKVFRMLNLGYMIVENSFDKNKMSHVSRLAHYEILIKILWIKNASDAKF